VERDPGLEYHADAGRQTVYANADGDGPRIGGTMQPELNLDGLFMFLASALGAISFTVCIVLLAGSRARWATFKQIFLGWIVVFFSGMAVALVGGPLFKSHLLAGILGSMSVGVASVAAAVLGIRHVRKVNRSYEEHTPLAIRS
jgi:hypothetical protein